MDELKSRFEEVAVGTVKNSAVMGVRIQPFVSCSYLCMEDNSKKTDEVMYGLVESYPITIQKQWKFSKLGINESSMNLGIICDHPVCDLHQKCPQCGYEHAKNLPVGVGRDFMCLGCKQRLRLTEATV